MLVCEADGAVVGFARFSFNERPWGKACELHTLVVSEAFRGKGVGRALMAASESAAMAAGAKGIRLDVLIGNDGGRAFYERLGYERFAWRYGKMLDES